MQCAGLTKLCLDKDGGYHGYWAQNLDKLNTNYGSGDDLKALIAEVQSRVSQTNVKK